MVFRTLLFSATVLSCSSRVSADQAPTVRFERASDQQITGLSWEKKQIRIIQVPVGSVTDAIVQLDGNYVFREEWTLYKVDQEQEELEPVPLNKDGDFQLKIPIEASTTVLQMVAKGPDDQVEAEEIQLEFPTFEFFHKRKKPPPPSSIRFSVGAGPAYISYSQAGTSSFSQIALTESANLVFGISKNWELGLGFKLFLPSLSSTISSVSAQHIGADLLVGYDMAPGPPGGFAFLFGGGYRSMSSSTSGLGFGSSMGFEVIPELRLRPSGGNPTRISVPTGFFSGSIEIGFAYEWAKKLASGTEIPVEFSFSDISGKVGGQAFRRDTVTVRVGGRW